MSQRANRLGRGRLFREVVGPGLLLGLYGLVLMVMLPSGLNRKFAIATALVVSAVVMGAIVASIVSTRARRFGVSDPDRTVSDAEQPHRSDVWLLALPMAPVVQYMLLNRDMVAWFGGFVGIAALAALAALLTLVIPYLVRRTMSRTVAMMVGLALSFLLFNMAGLAKSNHWREFGDTLQPLMIFAALVVGGVALYRYRREGAYLIAGLYFLTTLALIPLASEPTPVVASEARPSTADADAKATVLELIARSKAERLPDIIFLTYDAYVENETMLGYGIDNSDQEAFLESQGFDIQRGTYTVAGDSIGTMGRVLGGSTPGSGVAGDSPLLDALRTAGYQTIAVFQNDYFFWQGEPRYDESFPAAWPSYLAMLRGILEGAFRHDLAVITPPHEEFVEMKRTALTSDSSAPRLVYAHSGPSHSQNSGACLDDETERFEMRLAEANLEMREDVEAVLEHRPGAVVIVNGDHGPYLTKNCFDLQDGRYHADDVTRLDIQDRFGSFLAIRWPEGLEPREADIDVLQDVLPAVLGEVFPDLDSDALRGSTRLADGETSVIAGVGLEDGHIVGGQLDGTPLFEGDPD